MVLCISARYLGCLLIRQLNAFFLWFGLIFQGKWSCVINNYSADNSFLQPTDCKPKRLLIFQASNRSFFRGLHFWLLLSTYGETPVSSDDPLITALETLNLPLDGHVTVARPGPGRVFLQDVYRLADQPLTVTSAREWRPGRLLPPAPRRDDFNNIVLRAGVAVSAERGITAQSLDPLRTFLFFPFFCRLLCPSER